MNYYQLTQGAARKFETEARNDCERLGYLPVTWKLRRWSSRMAKRKHTLHLSGKTWQSEIPHKAWLVAGKIIELQLDDFPASFDHI